MHPPPLRIVVVTVLACGLGSCDSGPTGPVAGDLEFTVVSPNGPEGAALIELRGSGLGPITPLDSRVFAHALGDRTNVLVVRTSPGTIRFHMTVNDVQNLPIATVLDVAGGDNQLRNVSAGYRVEATVVSTP